MSGSTSIFSHTLKVRSYFDNAGGLREGSTVRLQGVDIGNVDSIRVVRERGATPVELTMKVNTKYASDLYKGSFVSIATEGVLGGSFIDIDSTKLDTTRPNYQQQAQN